MTPRTAIALLALAGLTFCRLRKRRPSITIAPDGSVTVDSGCNIGSGSVEITDTTLVFGTIAATLMACPPEQAELETNVFAVLRGEVTYEISGNTLSLRSGDGADAIGVELTADS